MSNEQARKLLNRVRINPEQGPKQSTHLGTGPLRLCATRTRLGIIRPNVTFNQKGLREITIPPLLNCHAQATDTEADFTKNELGQCHRGGLTCGRHVGKTVDQEERHVETVDICTVLHQYWENVSTRNTGIRTPDVLFPGCTSLNSFGSVKLSLLTQGLLIQSIRVESIPVCRGKLRCKILLKCASTREHSHLP